jgi:hypothetical protein
VEEAQCVDLMDLGQGASRPNGGGGGGRSSSRARSGRMDGWGSVVSTNRANKRERERGVFINHIEAGVAYAL